MSTLRSALDELASEDLSSTFDHALESDIVEIGRGLEMLQAQLLRRVGEIDQRQSFRHDGVLSTTAFLMDRGGMAGSTAREKVRVSRALPGMPKVAARFEDGDLTYSQVRLLATARETNPALFADHEEILAEAIAPLSIRQTRDALDHWRQAADPEDATRRMAAMHEHRRLHASKTFEGMIRLDGWFDPLDGDVVLTALAAITAADDRAAARASQRTTAAQRRADGLAEICRQWLDDGGPESGGERPHITLLVDLDTLERRTGRTCIASHAGVIDRESARKLACDAGLSRIITQGDSEPLDVGRRTRTIPPAIRRALVVRDGGCRYPTCDRPPAWCDGHHIEHWVNGGETKLDNLILLCRAHHTMIHRGGFTITHDEGGFEFRREDGRKLTPRSNHEVPALLPGPRAGSFVEVRGVEPRSAESSAPASPSAAFSKHSEQWDSDG